MGILNITPDSFSDGGLYLDPERALDRALQMEEEGADLIDIGAESTRPGAEPISEDEESKRLFPVFKKIAPRLKIPISIDTQKGKIARKAVEEGAVLINDVSALRDPEMVTLLAEKKMPIILMHMREEPRTMQKNVFYEDVLSEIGEFFRQKIDFAEARGIPRDKILIDPGIGFGKGNEDNFKIIRQLGEFKKWGCPIALGTSKKSFIRKTLGEDLSQVILGSLVTALFAAEHGASLLRVHNVRETKEVFRLARNLFFA